MERRKRGRGCRGRRGMIKGLKGKCGMEFSGYGLEGDLDRVPLSLTNFLSNSNVMILGIEIQENACKLKREYGVDCLCKKVDLRDLVKAWFPLSYKKSLD
ncbi:hypothetical protein Leryth_016495 [Lithospermum erythrorhizon]|nr:hypothetical protein Leryth_016495 [Lithospermum erythrorhizon]